MGKSNWRLKFLSRSVMSRVIKESTGVKVEGNTAIIFNKSSTVTESIVPNIFFIHSGTRYRGIKLIDYHVGFKFGEFTLTRKPHIYPKKSKSKSFRR